MVGSGAAEDRSSNGAYYPRVSGVIGDVIDMGESHWRCAAARAISRFKRVEVQRVTLLTRLLERQTDKRHSVARGYFFCRRYTSFTTGERPVSCMPASRSRSA
jgi:hypothetical protein